MPKAIKDVRPHVPTTVAPPIDKTVTRDGIRYYICGRRIFVADTYDKMFHVEHLPMKPKNYRDNELGKSKQLKGV